MSVTTTTPSSLRMPLCEQDLCALWAQAFNRHPQQCNAILEADAELVQLPGSHGYLAFTIDSLVEEISLGLYRLPETIGWMSVTISLSDLAAVGASPVGLTLAVNLPSRLDPDFCGRFAAAANAACEQAGTFILGGDTNTATGPFPVVTSAAVGIVDQAPVMTRKGMQPGDYVYATGPLGRGAALAARVFLNLADSVFAETAYRPRARLDEGKFLRRFASCCMDTSDGLLVTLDQLSILNGCGVHLGCSLEDILHPDASKIAQATGVSPLVFLGVLHGEFELVFAVPQARNQEFLQEASRCGIVPLALGRAGSSPGISLTFEGHDFAVDCDKLRSLMALAGGSVNAYFAALVRLLTPD